MADYNQTTPDAVSELVALRAWVVRMAHTVDGIAYLPARERSKEAARIAERMRNVVMAPSMVEACKRD